MATFYLSEFKGKDDRARFSAALEAAKEKPGSTLVVEPGVYRITSECAREIQASVMRGEYGNNPEPVMFSPDFAYDRGLDFSGHRGTCVEAYGAKLVIDGFMEDLSVRDCENVTVKGFDIDVERKPYTKATVTGVSEENGVKTASVKFAFPIEISSPILRSGVYSKKAGRLIPEFTDKVKLLSSSGLTGTLDMNGVEVDVGDEIYLCHTYHFRPSVLIENAVNTHIKDVTVRSHAGMGLTAFRSKNILLERFNVKPSAGEHFSTNTDAAHFSSCRGRLTLDGCVFEGQGDDGINVHTYYYTVAENNGTSAKLKVMSPTWTHTQKTDCPAPGDRLELIDRESLEVLSSFKVISASVDEEARSCEVALDGALPDDMSGYYLADPDETPDVTIKNSLFKDHFARAMLIKSRRCLIENCTVENVFELAVKVAPEWSWHEGVNSEDVTVRGCVFRNCGTLFCGRVTRRCGGIEVYDEAKTRKAVHGSVTVTGNVIDCPECDHGVIVKDAKKVEISGNTVSSKSDDVVIEGLSD